VAIDLSRLRKGRRWLCCACYAEGAGSVPDECPSCGSTESWFVSADDGSTESMRDRWHRMWNEILGDSGTIH